MKWYASKSAGSHQGIVADEETGKSIAVTYDPADAPLIAAAPTMLAALQAAEAHIYEAMTEIADGHAKSDLQTAHKRIQAAIAEAT